MKPEDLKCDDILRRRELREHGRSRGVSGLGSVEVLRSEGGRPELLVTFIGGAPRRLRPEDLVIEGGRASSQPPRVIAIKRGETRGGDDRVQLALAGAHDHSIYTLRLVLPPGSGWAVDPRHDRVRFSFELDCPRVDCSPCVADDGDPPFELARQTPEIDYLAKDYQSFRRLILDRLSLLVPAWTERHEADVGIMLVELLAYVGDQLSYFQDAVATEAYIGTARQRISIRRHARLVDHQLHEGNNARAWVHVAIDGAETVSWAWDELMFATQGESGAGEVFLPMRIDDAPELRVHRALDEVSIYTWGEAECCVPRGATSTTLVLENGLLRRGDFLLFEEVLGPRTGRRTDADPEHRHVVRLTRAEPVTDPLDPQISLVEVEWKAEDALPFPLCLSTIGAPPECAELHDVTIARGNVFLVDHGRWEGPKALGTVPLANVPDRCDGPGRVADEERISGRFRPRITRGQITFRAPLPPDDPCLPFATALPSAAALVRPDPRRAEPQIEVLELDPRVSTGPERWSPRGDLLESGPDERVFAVEIDDQSFAWLRFGDGTLGRRPTACATMTARYRVGNGPAGNVGRDTITRVWASKAPKGVALTVRNPLPAKGGTAAEPLEDARQLIAAAPPQALERAITAEDYEAIAERDIEGLQAASAERLWNGSWYEIHVALDPAGRDDVDEVLLCRARRVLERVRRIGHDVHVAAAVRVPLRIKLWICVAPGHLRAHVRAAIVRALGPGVLPDGSRGLFHPDELSFGEPVRLSRVVARVGRIEGVVSVRVGRFERLFEGAHGELEQGFIPLGRMEIARLDNDPVRPEHGVLDVMLEGGR